LLAKGFFLGVCCVAAGDDHGGRAGAIRCQFIARWRRSVASREAKVVLYRAMRAESQRRIRMVIENAGEPSVFFS